MVGRFSMRLQLGGPHDPHASDSAEPSEMLGGASSKTIVDLATYEL